MHKCDKCNKNITKRSPGVECSKCEKHVHVAKECSGLTTKQRNALRANTNLEWSCEECLQMSPKRHSIFIPDEDEDEEDYIHRVIGSSTSNHSMQLDTKKLLKDIYTEMEKALSKEMTKVHQSLQIHTDKVEEILDSMDAFKQTIQDLRKKNVELTNKNNHLTTRVGALEQRVQELEQKQLQKNIEIANVPYHENESVTEVVKKIAQKLQLPIEDIEVSKRSSNKNDRPAIIHVRLDKESTQEKWLQKARITPIFTSDNMAAQTSSSKKLPIQIREALTHYNKKLLWDAKQKLKDSFKYIWCKKGVIRVRKDDKAASVIIRNEEDITKLLAN